MFSQKLGVWRGGFVLNTDKCSFLYTEFNFAPFLNCVVYVVLQFHTEALTALLADDNKFGFIVMDGNGALFGTLQGNTREVLHKFTVDLPKKHGEHWPKLNYILFVHFIYSQVVLMFLQWCLS